MGKKDSWIEEFEALGQSGDAIMALVTERNRLLRSGGDALKVSARIRQSQNNFSYDLTALQRDLERDRSSKKLSPKEYDRRRNLLNEAEIRKKEIQKAFEDKGKTSLMSSGMSNPAYEPEESENTVGYSNSELTAQQQETMNVQDDGLKRIAQIVRRQKEIGIAIGDEIDGQNEIIDELTDRTEATAGRISRQTRAVNHVSRKEGSVCAGMSDVATERNFDAGSHPVAMVTNPLHVAPCPEQPDIRSIQSYRSETENKSLSPECTREVPPPAHLYEPPLPALGSAPNPAFDSTLSLTLLTPVLPPKTPAVAAESLVPPSETSSDTTLTVLAGRIPQHQDTPIPDFVDVEGGNRMILEAFCQNEAEDEDVDSHLDGSDPNTRVKTELFPCRSVSLSSSSSSTEVGTWTEGPGAADGGGIGRSYSPGEDSKFPWPWSVAKRNGKKVFTCLAENCNQNFGKKCLLNYHIDLRHKKLKWHTCIYKGCGKSFYHVSQMKRHLRIHRPNSYFCSFCYQYYSTKYNLWIHRQKCRLVLICSVCGCTFITRSDMTRHREIHCVYVKCVYADCPERLTPEQVYEHLVGHENTLRCPLCTLLFASTPNLEQHVTRDHKAEFVDGSYSWDVDFEEWFRDFCRTTAEGEEDGDEGLVDLMQPLGDGGVGDGVNEGVVGDDLDEGVRRDVLTHPVAHQASSFTSSSSIVGDSGVTVNGGVVGDATPTPTDWSREATQVGAQNQDPLPPPSPSPSTTNCTSLATNKRRTRSTKLKMGPKPKDPKRNNPKLRNTKSKDDNSKPCNKNNTPCSNSSKPKSDSRTFNNVGCDGNKLKSTLKTTENSGSGGSLYQCTECEYSTTSPRWLTKHTLRHRQNKNLTCEVCNVRFSDKWSLKLHSARHNAQQKSFTCDFCPAKFIAQSRLSEHCQNNHPESRKWKCNECNQSFVTNRRLMLHYKRHITQENKP